LGLAKEVFIIEAKTVDQSEFSRGEIMQPGQANFSGNVHGGEIMKIMDNVAGVVALRHAKVNVVTARVDEMEFHHPIHIGDLVICKGKVTFVGKSSLEVLVTVLVEDVLKDAPVKTALTALFTMVALTPEGTSAHVPSLEITNDEERKYFEKGRERYLAYKQKRSQQVQ